LLGLGLLLVNTS